MDAAPEHAPNPPTASAESGRSSAPAPGDHTAGPPAPAPYAPPAPSAAGSPGPALDTASLERPSLYINREVSWLDFNDRVLQLAEDERVPLLERVKFCAIYTTNLDEYYMVRVAGLRDQIDAGVETPSQDGHTPSETIALIREKVLEQGRRLTDCFERRLRPALYDQDIRIVSADEPDDQRRAELARPFPKAIFPALTPLPVPPARP